MERSEIKVGDLLACRITNRWTKVKVLAESPLGGFYVLNPRTGRRLTAKLDRLQPLDCLPGLRQKVIRGEWKTWDGKLVKNTETGEVLIATDRSELKAREWVWQQLREDGCPMPFPADHLVFHGGLSSYYEELTDGGKTDA